MPQGSASGSCDCYGNPAHTVGLRVHLRSHLLRQLQWLQIWLVIQHSVGTVATVLFNTDFFFLEQIAFLIQSFLSEKEPSEQSVAYIILLRVSLGEVESCKPALEVCSCLLGRQQSVNDSAGAIAKQSF